MKTNLELCLDIELSHLRIKFGEAKREYEEGLYQFITNHLFSRDQFDIEWTTAIDELIEEFYDTPSLTRIAIYNQMIGNAFSYGIEESNIQ